jgi:hypothetical protein
MCKKVRSGMSVGHQLAAACLTAQQEAFKAVVATGDADQPELIAQATEAISNLDLYLISLEMDQLRLKMLHCLATHDHDGWNALKVNKSCTWEEWKDLLSAIITSRPVLNG